MKCFLLSAAILAVAVAQQQQYTTPVPILKQINKHNEDGSYSYGYEAADGTFKIESKYPNGEVYGKYGYLDDSGKLREIEYGATRRGFEPAGNEINVPPPTLVQNQEAVRPLGPNEEDDGQYREDPSVYYKDEKYNNNQQQQATPFRFNQVNYQQQQPAQQAYQPQQQAYQPQPQPQAYQQPARPVTQHGFLNSYQQPTSYQQPSSYQAPQQPAFRPQPSYAPAPVQPRYFNPAHPNFNPYQGHPATNIDINSGSYSVNYKR